MDKKPSINQNLLVLAVVVVLIAVVAVVAASQTRTLNPTLGTLEADPTATPEATEAVAAAVPESTEALSEAEPTVDPADAFLVVTVAGEMFEPIALYEEGRYTITRGEMVNVIAVTRDSVTMHSSTCDNQDCVLQGTVSLENRKGRVLQNMIICLPNEVMLELYTREEITELLLNMIGYTGEEAADE